MSTTRELKVVFQKRRDKAIRELENRRSEIYTFIPEIKSIDKQINKLGLSIAMASIKNPYQATLEMKAIEHEIKTLLEDKLVLLTEKKIPRDFLTVDFKCKICDDTGFLKTGKPCSCYKQEQIKISYEHSNITAVLDRENFDTFNLDIFSTEYNAAYKTTPKEHMMTVLANCESFVYDFEKKNQNNMLFFGQTGLGKTFLCNCIAKALLDKGHTVLYQTSFRIIDTISNYRFSNKKTPDMRFKYNMLINCDLLIVDDLGTEMTNTFSTTELFNIINTRLLEDKKTIISTNYTPQQLSETYSERITSRLFGQFEFVAFFGKDLRWEV